MDVQVYRFLYLLRSQIESSNARGRLLFRAGGSVAIGTLIEAVHDGLVMPVKAVTAVTGNRPVFLVIEVSELASASVDIFTP